MKTKVLKASEYIRTGGFESTSIFVLKKSNDISWPSEEAYPQGKIPIRNLKTKKILPYIPEDNKDSYDQLVEWLIADDAFLNDDE